MQGERLVSEDWKVSISRRGLESEDLKVRNGK